VGEKRFGTSARKTGNWNVTVLSSSVSRCSARFRKPVSHRGVRFFLDCQPLSLEQLHSNAGEFFGGRMQIDGITRHTGAGIDDRSGLVFPIFLRRPVRYGRDRDRMFRMFGGLLIARQRTWPIPRSEIAHPLPILVLATPQRGRFGIRWIATCHNTTTAQVANEASRVVSVMGAAVRPFAVPPVRCCSGPGSHHGC